MKALPYKAVSEHAAIMFPLPGSGCHTHTGYNINIHI